MKKLLTLFFALTCATSIFAHDCVVDGIYYNLNKETKTATVTYKGKDYKKHTDRYVGAITIPQSIVVKGQTYSVTTIGKSAFEYCEGLTSVSIPNSVKTIGDDAFSGCKNLTSITIPNSVKTIGNSAFDKCSGLTSITIPNSVTTIGWKAFEGCSGLTSITIPNSVTSIGGYAFNDCSGLTSITIPNSVTTIEWEAFYGCKGLTSITIPDSVTTIEFGAFSGCSGLTSITIPNSVTTIEFGAFSGCSGLTSITIPNSATSIGNQVFYGCSKLTSITWNAKKCNTCYFGDQVESFTFGNEVESIPASLCSGMSKLTSVTIPNSVTTIGESAFTGCSGLTSIEIPNSVTSIGKEAFSNCSRLTSVTILNPNVKIDEQAFYKCTITDFYCGESVDMSKVDGTIKNVHRLSGEELLCLLPFDQWMKAFVESQINEWQKKGEFEKTSDWQKRVTETSRKQKIDSLVSVAKKVYLADYKKKNSLTFTLGAYDADNEVYLVKGSSGQNILVAVPIADASYVKQNWDSSTAKPHYAFAGTDVVLQSVDFTFPNKKTYTYKPSQDLTYAKADIQYNFNPIELPDLQTVTMGGVAQVTQTPLATQTPQGITEMIVTTPFDLTPMSSVLVSYKNIFGKYEMPDLDVTFPYVVIRVKLTGTPNLIRLAKQSLSLDLGQLYIVEQTVQQDDKILFLVPTGVRNIYLTDGNGQRQLLYSGRLQPNTIYDGTVEVK